MFDGFVLKKLISMFVQVIPGVPILLLISLLLRRWLPKLSYELSLFLTILLIGLSLPSVSNHFVAKLENSYPPLAETPSDTAAVLVLGYGHNEAPDRPPNSILTAGALSRLMEGIRLWQSKPDTLLIVSGAGLYGSVSHAQAMKNMALTLGVPDNKITTFHHTRDTAEEILAAVQLVQQSDHASDTARLVVVSSATHLPRAATMLNRHSIAFSMAPTDYLAGYAPWYRADSNYVTNFDRALHEWVGMLWFHLKHAFQ